MCQDLTLARLKHSIVDAGLATAVAVAVVMLIIMASSLVGWILTFEQLPAAFVTLVQTTLGEKWMIILAMNFIMLAIGMFIDLPAAVLLLTPMFVPLAAASGMDTVRRLSPLYDIQSGCLRVLQYPGSRL